MNLKHLLFDTLPFDVGTTRWLILSNRISFDFDLQLSMMNWATIAPESRLYKGKNLFRWDVSPGLEHHCGICATPLHNGRAKTSCIGKHVEPCYRFHQQLHFIGRSHECFGCNHSDEMHHNRHKEILTLVRKIKALDETNNANLAGCDFPISDKSRRSSTFTTSTSTPTETNSEVGDEAPKMKKSERKKAKKLGLGSISKKPKVEAFPKEGTDYISEAIHLTVHETKGGWEGSYNYEKHPEGVQQSIPEDEEVEDIIDQTVNLSVKTPGTPSSLTPRQRKCVKTFSTPVKHVGYRGGSRKFSPNGLSANPYDGVDPRIFYRLGIEVVGPVKNSVARKELVAKVVAAVKNDIAIITQENAETETRREGFLRWAGKSAWNEIMKRRLELDWATGQKIGTQRKESGTPVDYPRFDDEATDACTPDRDDATADCGQTISTKADDDPPIKEKLDFAIKAEVKAVTEERMDVVEEEWEIPSARRTVRKRRTEGGRAFVTAAKAGGTPTLRITAS